MAWQNYPRMLAVEELELETGDMHYLVETKKLAACVIFWPLVETANAFYEFYLDHIKKGGTDAQ